MCFHMIRILINDQLLMDHHLTPPYTHTIASSNIWTQYFRCLLAAGRGITHSTAWLVAPPSLRRPNTILRAGNLGWARFPPNPHNQS